MDKRSLYDGLNQLESELRNTLTELVEMKHALHEIVEKNTTLEMENQRLREHLRELNQVAQAPAENVKQELSRRDNDEPCAFCLEVIYRESGR